MNIGFVGILFIAVAAYLIVEIKNRAQAEKILKNSFNNSTQIITNFNRKVGFLKSVIADYEDNEIDFQSDSFSDKRKRHRIQKEIKYCRKEITAINEVKSNYIKLLELYRETNGQMNTPEAHTQLLNWVKSKSNSYLGQ